MKDSDSKSPKKVKFKDSQGNKLTASYDEYDEEEHEHRFW